MTNQDPMREALLVMAHVEEESIKKKEKEQQHETITHDMGFSLAFETPQGIVALWSCWLGDQLYIGYPKEWTVSDELIKETLNMTDAKPVARKERLLGGDYRDSTRQWAKFYGEPIESGGRVWVDHNECDANGRNFYLIQQENLKQIYRGHDESKNIHNIGFSYFNEQEPDAPNANKECVQVYKNAFIQLALRIANEHGGVKAVHVQYEFTALTPALLETVGYTDIRYLKGNSEYRESFGGTVVYAKKENEEIILESGNSLVPWVNIRKISITEELTVEKVLNQALVF